MKKKLPKNQQQINLNAANTAAYTGKGGPAVNDQTIVQEPAKATRIFITCMNPIAKGLLQNRVETILKQWNPIYSIFIYGHYEVEWSNNRFQPKTYLQIYMELEVPENPRQIAASFFTKQYEIPHPDCHSTTMRDWVSKTGVFTTHIHFEHPDSLPVESGICPGDITSLSQFWKDFVEIIKLVKKGYSDHAIVKKYPSATTHLYEINAYREYYLSDPEHYYDYISKEVEENE